jgi:hypothetical protein
MIRRRFRNREIAFSFDSFLDVVANVVGIIIRLILVVWVGARSYSSVQNVQPDDAATQAATAQAEPNDPLAAELARRRQDLEHARKRLLEQMRQLQETQDTEKRVAGEWSTLAAQREQLQQEQTIASQAGNATRQAGQTGAASMAELRERSKHLTEEIRALEKEPAPRKTLRYHTPVSKPLDAEELLFECNHGRVTFVDLAAFLAEVQRGMEDKGRELRNQWRTSGFVGPSGAFRLRYTIERERSMTDSLGADEAPASANSYRFNLSMWQLEPVQLDRGETAERAFQPASEFRQVADGLDARQQAVTFWVYPDSFALYRQLRDYLYEKGIVVAGRPLPEGVPISATRRGSLSRGQ